MQMIVCFVRWLDRLAEVVVFDRLLSTRGRRFACGAGIGLAAYLGAGFVLAPSEALEVWPEIAYQAGKIGPFDPVAPDGPLSYGKDPFGKAEDRAALVAWLAGQAGPLDRAVELAAGDFPVFPQVPSYRHLRDLVNALGARARLEGEEGRTGNAIRDLVAASRIGRAPLCGYGDHKPTLIDGMIAVACFGAFEKEASRLLAADRLTGLEIAKLVPELSAWRKAWPDAGGMLQGDLAYLQAMLDGWAATGRLPAGTDGESALRLILPLGAAARTEFATEVGSRVRANFSEDLARADRNESVTPDEWTFGAAFELALAPFRRESAIRVLVYWIRVVATPNFRAAQKRLDARAIQRGDLALACLEARTR